MKKLIFLLLLSLAIGVNGQLIRSTKHPQFYFSTRTATHSEAKTACKSGNFRLVSITNNATHTKVAFVIENELQKKAWSSGKVVSGQWKWSTNKVINTTSKYWGGEIGETVSTNCLLLRNPKDKSQVGYWKAKSCADSERYICEDYCWNQCSTAQTCSPSDTSPFYTCTEAETTVKPATTSPSINTISTTTTSPPTTTISTTTTTTATSANTDGCISSPCGQFGTCTSTTNSPYYKCLCDLPEYGDRCEKLHCRDDSPCLNGGNCKKSRYSPGYTCTCVNGYSGFTCEKDACHGSPCKNSGTCTLSNTVTGTYDRGGTQVDGYFTCSCRLPYYGYQCKQKFCTNKNPCLNGGRCNTLTSKPGYRCTCRNGYTGITCENDSCHDSPCDNGGTCTHSNSFIRRYVGGKSVYDYFTCKCKNPYHGYKCQQKFCRDTNFCINGGICTPSTSAPGYTCSCINGYNGDTCQHDACYSKPCGYQYHGICTTNSTTPYYTCQCRLPYYGTTCSQRFCTNTDPCLNGGTCYALTFKPGYQCTCVNGYTGDRCENDGCHSSPCENGGTCTHSNTDTGYDHDKRVYKYYTCTCPAAYKGYKCQYDACSDPSSTRCNTGTCTATPNTFPYYSCQCSLPYYGGNCDKKHCDDTKPCLHGGRCTPSTSSPGYTCSCINGYSGGTCERDGCHDSPCENDGTCTHSNTYTPRKVGGKSVYNYFTCKCKNPYHGYKCQKKYCRESNPCGNGGGCIPSRSYPGYTCSCINGYNGDTCQHDACYSKPCGDQYHGRCTTTETTPYHTCQCRLPYYGTTCSKEYCTDQNPCLNGATCKSKTYSPGYECTCINGYTGDTCDRDGCYGRPCENGGTCSHSNTRQSYEYYGRRYPYGHYTCACSLPYFGYKCQKKFCGSSDPKRYSRCTSSDRGTCSSSTQSPGFTCACNAKYFGLTCNKVHCIDSSPCQNGGKCTRSSSQPGYKCQCVNGYSGDTCINDPCYSSPCGDNGKCAVTLEGPNYYNCTCTLPYYGNGTHCNQKHCIDSDTCQKGKCNPWTKEPGYICQCANGYNGNNCEHDACYLKPCQERGKCKVITEPPYSSCSCDLPYFGATCEKAHCVDTSPCQNNGNCSQLTGERGFRCTCSDEYHGDNCESKVLSLAGPVGGGITGFLIAVVIIVVILWAVRKRSSVKPEKDETEMTSVIAATRRQESSNDDVIVAFRNPASPLEAVVAEMENVYENFNPNIQQNVGVSISISQLLERFENLRKDDFFVLRNEFNQLKTQTKKQDHELNTLASVAKRQENAVKNRYKNIIPFDNARVVLSTSDNNPNSNYINASYIKLNGKTFIAAQGPKVETIVDFWRMVWQERSKTIVMLTSLNENGKKKCDQYWPDVGEEKVYGNITILCKDEMRKGNFLKRRLSVKRAGKARVIFQLHYIAWPDHGVPLTTTGLMRLRLELNETSEDKRFGPTIVHCSAGVGRTGTFIAYVDLVRNEGNDLNVYNTVLEMRKQRIFMVQTADQYIFLYKLITEYHALEDSDHKIDDFDQVMATINRNENTYREENQKSTMIRPMATSICKLPKNEDNFSLYQHSKIRFNCTPEGNIIHYNGSFVEVYGIDEKVMVVSDPKRNQLEKFWLIALSNEVKIIFTIGSSQQWNNSLLPHAVGQTMKMMTNCQLKWVKTEHGDHRGMTINHVTVIQNINELSIVQVQLDEWPSDDLYSLCRVIDSLEDSLQKSGGPVLVHSRMGEETSGVFLAIWNLYKRMKVEKKFDVLRTIKDLTDMRVGIFNNHASHEQLYGFIQSYVQNSDVNLYANIQLRSVSER